MNTITKVLLTVPSVITIIYMVTFWDSAFLFWISQNLIDSYTFDKIVSVLNIVQLTIILIQIWSYKSTNNKLKTKWTLLILFFNFLVNLIYIWVIDAKFNKENMSKNTSR